MTTKTTKRKRKKPRPVNVIADADWLEEIVVDVCCADRLPAKG